MSNRARWGRAAVGTLVILLAGLATAQATGIPDKSLIADGIVSILVLRLLYDVRDLKVLVAMKFEHYDGLERRVDANTQKVVESEREYRRLVSESDALTRSMVKDHRGEVSVQLIDIEDRLSARIERVERKQDPRAHRRS